jgi:hypothetical protein
VNAGFCYKSASVLECSRPVCGTNTRVHELLFTPVTLGVSLADGLKTAKS